MRTAPWDQRKKRRLARISAIYSLRMTQFRCSCHRPCGFCPASRERSARLGGTRMIDRSFPRTDAGNSARRRTLRVHSHSRSRDSPRSTRVHPSHTLPIDAIGVCSQTSRTNRCGWCSFAGDRNASAALRSLKCSCALSIELASRACKGERYSHSLRPSSGYDVLPTNYMQRILAPLHGPSTHTLRVPTGAGAISSRRRASRQTPIPVICVSYCACTCASNRLTHFKSAVTQHRHAALRVTEMA